MKTTKTGNILPEPIIEDKCPYQIAKCGYIRCLERELEEAREALKQIKKIVEVSANGQNT